ncbi:MAG: BrnT family toxin [Rhodoferax sp.]
MKFFRWGHEKNATLKRERGVSFEEIVLAIEADGVLDELQHPNVQRYPHQRILVVELAGYAYLVPFVEDEESFFLKTIIPSRKATRDYLGPGASHEQTDT